jgi:hypothetical protein
MKREVVCSFSIRKKEKQGATWTLLLLKPKT